MTEEAKIDAYIQRRGRRIIDLIAEGLRSAGLVVSQGIMSNQCQLSVTNGRIKGVVDVTDTIRQIATDNDRFDNRLISSSYELLKTNVVLITRLKVIIAYFKGTTEGDRMDRISELTKDGNLEVQIFR